MPNKSGDRIGGEISPPKLPKMEETKMAQAKKKSSKDSKAETSKAVDTSEMSEMIPVVIAGQSLTGIFREFSSGSKGYNVNGKIIIDGLKCQVSANIVVVGSKPAAK